MDIVAIEFIRKHDDFSLKLYIEDIVCKWIIISDLKMLCNFIIVDAVQRTYSVQRRIKCV